MNHIQTKIMTSQDRYVPNEKFGGRKEKDGFVCSSVTRKTLLGQNCVAVKMDETGVHLRDTKDQEDKTLSFTTDEWSAFTDGVKKENLTPKLYLKSQRTRLKTCSFFNTKK